MDTLPLHSLHQRSGAVFGERAGREVVRHHGDANAEYAAARSAGVRVDLSFRDALRITGEDRASFLHGMCTNDVNALAEWGVAYAAMVTVKGSMVSDARIVKRASDIVLDLEPGQYEKVREFLEKYLISEDAELHDGRGDVAVIGLVGPKSYELVRAAFGLSEAPKPQRSAFAPPGQQPTTAPVIVGFEPSRITLPAGAGTSPLPSGEGQGEGAASSNAIVLMPSLTSREDAVDLLLPRAQLEAVWTRLADASASLGVLAAGVDALELLRVEDGVPRFGADLLESTIPLEAELLHAISYNKGCYVGQEVIARATFRGHMNKKLVGLSLGEGGGDVTSGTDLRADGKKIGFVTTVVRSPSRKEFVALGYVHRAHLAPGTALQLGETDKQATVEALPLRR